jgi:hypothetical protein
VILAVSIFVSLFFYRRNRKSAIETGQFTLTLDSYGTLYLPAQNTTLTELTIGEQSIAIQAYDLAGNPGYSNYVKSQLKDRRQRLLQLHPFQSYLG